MRYKFVAFFLVTLLAVSVQTANILGAFPVNSPSHLTLHMALIRALLERGHNVTMVTSNPLKDRHPNLHHIFVPISYKRADQMLLKKSQMTSANSRFEMMFKSMNVVIAMGPSQFDVLRHPTFQDFMKNPHNKFDLLIIGFFFNDYLFGLGAHFDCPIIISWVGSSNIFVGRHIANPTELSYTTSFQVLGEMDPRKFTGRLAQLFGALISSIIIAVMNVQMQGYYNQLFPQPQYPSMEEAGKKVSLVFCNTHFTEGNIHPSVPALIEIGGIQIKEKPDPLPIDIAAILDAADEHGVIYVSLGTNIDPGDLKVGIIENIYAVVSQLPQTIIWKWNCKNLPGTSPNIHCWEWLPQNSILAHRNMRLFITHAGKSSTNEAQYHGVPMVAMPIFADQPFNADALTRKGFGLQVNFFYMTEAALRSAVLEVLGNSSYKLNVMRFAELYKDRPMSARDVAIYWTEYVIKHKGAYHMQSPLVHLNNLQNLFIDVIAFIFAVIFVVIKLVRWIFGWLRRRLFPRRCRSVKLKLN